MALPFSSFFSALRSDPHNPWGSPPNQGGQQGSQPQKPRGGPSKGPEGPSSPFNVKDFFSYGGGNGGGGGGFGNLPPQFSNNPRRTIALAAGVVGLLWLASGFYVVNSDEEGIVLMFGQYSRTTPPGFHYRLPWPFESVTRLPVTRVHRVDIGVSREGGGSTKEETLMLTGDENIVEANFSVFWVIDDARNFLFKVRDPEQTIKVAADSVIRDVIGQTPISVILTGGRGKIESDIKLKLQNLMKNYHTGVRITQVQLQGANPPEQVLDAYRDVQAAKADQERLKNEAETYRNKIVPEARGEASKIEQDAMAYKERVIAKAQGDSDRFNLVFQAYQQNPDLFRKRLHLETMEQVLKGKKKMVIDQAVVAKGGMMSYLPLNQMGK